MDDKEKTSTTSFNMSLATLQRIDNILSLLNHPSLSGKPALHMNLDKSLYMELYPFLDDKEKKDGDAMLADIYSQLVYGESEPKVKTAVWGKMAKMEFWMRQTLHDKGLLMAKSDNPANALGGM